MLLVDSNVWIAWLVPSDSLHNRATAALEELIEKGANIAMSDHILAEVSTVLLYDEGREAANKFLELALGNQQLKIHTLSATEVREISEKFKKSSRKLSFTDEVLRFLSDKYGYTLLTYDADLAKAK